MSYWTTRVTLAALGLVAFGGCALDREGAAAPGSGEGGAATTSTGTSTSTSSAGGGGAGGATSSSSQGGGPSEDCLDGLDNDADGMIDCADADCQPDHECVPEVPASWEGYYRVATAAFPVGDPSPCPDATPPVPYYGAPGGPAQCEACGCGGVEGATCSLPTLAWWINSSMCSGGPPSAVFAPPDTGCVALPAGFTCLGSCSNDQVCRTEASVLMGQPVCPPIGGAPTVPPTWGDEQHACRSQAVGAGCLDAMVCVAKSPAPYDLAACVFQQGSHACPGDWPNAIDAYTDSMDDRGCSACSCDIANPDCEGEKFTVFDDNVCGNGGSSSPVDVAPAACVSAQNHVDNNLGSYQATAATLTGTCTPQGGEPTGELVPTGPVTFCCR